ncbi:trithorax group protein osa-like isoform X2 [Mirounga leonina]|uniref:trithorax group protein osa-like isoform X2 n=1 Tax=Mirounga leonina TaxID=9715 RepID=UPI00156C332B|nr:trithorax group protein osa-like isoform X2 [Mirounga leonina]
MFCLCRGTNSRFGGVGDRPHGRWRRASTRPRAGLPPRSPHPAPRYFYCSFLLLGFCLQPRGWLQAAVPGCAPGRGAGWGGRGAGRAAWRLSRASPIAHSEAPLATGVRGKGLWGQRLCGAGQDVPPSPLHPGQPHPQGALGPRELQEAPWLGGGCQQCLGGRTFPFFLPWQAGPALEGKPSVCPSPLDVLSPSARQARPDWGGWPGAWARGGRTQTPSATSLPGLVSGGPVVSPCPPHASAPEFSVETHSPQNWLRFSLSYPEPRDLQSAWRTGGPLFLLGEICHGAPCHLPSPLPASQIQGAFIYRVG